MSSVPSLPPLAWCPPVSVNQAEEAPKQIRKYHNTAAHLIGHTWHTRALLSKNTFRDTHCELDSEQHKQMTSELCFVSCILDILSF